MLPFQLWILIFSSVATDFSFITYSHICEHNRGTWIILWIVGAATTLTWIFQSGAATTLTWNRFTGASAASTRIFLNFIQGACNFLTGAAAALRLTTTTAPVSQSTGRAQGLATLTEKVPLFSFKHHHLITDNWRFWRFWLILCGLFYPGPKSGKLPSVFNEANRPILGN